MRTSTSICILLRNKIRREGIAFSSLSCSDGSRAPDNCKYREGRHGAPHRGGGGRRGGGARDGVPRRDDEEEELLLCFSTLSY